MSALYMEKVNVLLVYHLMFDKLLCYTEVYIDGCVLFFSASFSPLHRVYSIINYASLVCLWSVIAKSYLKCLLGSGLSSISVLVIFSEYYWVTQKLPYIYL